MVYVTHCLGLAIIFVGCDDCPEFLFYDIQIWPAFRIYCTGELYNLLTDTFFSQHLLSEAVVSIVHYVLDMYYFYLLQEICLNLITQNCLSNIVVSKSSINLYYIKNCIC